MKTGHKRLLIAIAVVLVGIFAVILMKTSKETQSDKIAGSIGDVLDSAGDGLHEFREEVKDEIDDNTDAK